MRKVVILIILFALAVVGNTMPLDNIPRESGFIVCDPAWPGDGEILIPGSTSSSQGT